MLSRIAILILLLFCVAWAQAMLTLPGRMAPAGEIATLLNQERPTYHVQRAAARPVIDGKIDEWADVPAMVLDKKEQSRGWNGPDDLHGALRLQWDDDGLYFCLTVVDDVHSAPKTEGGWWENDCCQFVFDPYMNGPKGSYDPDEGSFAVGDSPKGPFFVAYRQPGRPSEQEQVLATRSLKMAAPDEKTRVFEWSMSWRELAPVSPRLLGRSGFTFTLNDNDGNGFEGALAWTNGILSRQDASQFGLLVFDDAVGTQPAALGLRPEERITGNETGRYLVTPGVEPWCTARLLASLPQDGPIEAGITVYLVGGKKPVAAGTVRGEAKAKVPVLCAWDTSALPSGEYEITFRLNGKPAEPGRRMAFFRLGTEELRGKAAALRQQYGLDRPWDAMTEAPPLVRKYRGQVALLLQLLEDDRWAQQLIGVDRQDAYMRQLTALTGMLHELEQGRDVLAAQRGNFFWSYFCPADASGQSFVICLPPSFDPKKTYPLLVNLHSAASVPGPTFIARSNRDDCIEVLPWGRGSYSAFRQLGERDVLDVIDYMQAWYRIDPDRICLTGASMGGFGVWGLACQYPDRFAAAASLCGLPNQMPLENLQNLPFMSQHGDQDWTVPVDLDRLAVQRLQGMGYPALYLEFKGAPHNIFGRYQPGDWLLARQRAQRPEAVTFTCDTPAAPGNSAYWLAIRRFNDPHLRASARARVIGSGAHQSLAVSCENVAVLELDVTAMPVNRKAGLLVQLGSTVLEREGPLPDHLYLLHQDGKWELAEQWSPPASPMRPYQPGGAQNLYRGEPLLIVCGTRGGEERTKVLRALADRLALFCGDGDVMPAGRFPVKTDAEVTAEDMQHYNLLILGGVADNTLTAMLLPKLPFSINSNNELTVAGRPPLKLDGGVYDLSYYNPLAPQRLIYLAGFDEKVDLKAFLDFPPGLLNGLWVDAPGDVADLVVWAAGAEYHLQFTDGWQWVAFPDATRPLPPAYNDRNAREQAKWAVMRQMARADYALGVAGKRNAPGKQTITQADIQTERSVLRTLTSEISGADLQAMLDSQNEDALTAANPLPEKIDPQRTYRVVFDEGFVVWVSSLGQRSLPVLNSGPTITREMLMKAYMEMK